MLDLILHFASMVLVPAFLIGMVGSGIVVMVTVFRDVRDFRSKDTPIESAQTKLKTPPATA